MKKFCIYFYLNKINLYSFKALLSPLDKYIDKLTNIDFFIHKKNLSIYDEIEELSKSYRKVIICFSIKSPEIFEYKILIKELKKRYKEKIIIICGGPHPSGLPKIMIKEGADIVLIGESEETFLKLLIALTNDYDLKNINSICFKENDLIIETNKANYIDINEFNSYSEKFNLYGPIEITRGCFYACSYCQLNSLFGCRPRHRNLDNILKHVEVLKKYNLKDIRFITPSLFYYGTDNPKKINLEIIEKLFYEIKKILGGDGRLFIGTFPSEVRPEHINNETIIIIKKYADNNNIIIGAQTGSERLLNFLNRKHSINDVINAVVLCKKNNIIPKVDFIFGTPTETDTDTRDTLNLISYLVKLGAIIHAHYYIPLPNTKLFGLESTKLTPETKKFLEDLTSKGFLYGNWKKQMLISKKLYQYYNNCLNETSY